MLPFGVTIPATVPQGSEIPEGLMNNPVDAVSGISQKTVSSLTFLILEVHGPNLGQDS